MDESDHLWDKLTHKFKNSKVGVFILIILGFISTFESIKSFIVTHLPSEQKTAKDILLVNGLLYKDLEQRHGGSPPENGSPGRINKSFRAKVTLSLAKDYVGALSVQGIRPTCQKISGSHDNPKVTPIDADESPVFGTSTPDVFNIVYIDNGVKLSRVAEDNSVEIITSGDLLDSKPRKIITLNDTDQKLHFLDLKISNYMDIPCAFRLTFSIDYLGDRDEIQINSVHVFP